MKLLGLSVILTGALAAPAMACDLCSIYSAMEAQGGQSSGVFGGVAESYNHFGTLRNGGHVVQNDGEFIDSSVSQLFVGYSFTEDLNIQLNVPIIYRSYGSDAAGKYSESGVGDISLIGTYTAYRKDTDNFSFNWSVLGGIKFPTGNPNHLSDDDFAAGIGGHDLALGSGSYDGVVGTGMMARWKRLFFTASVQYAIRTQGAFGHQYANDATWSGGPGIYLALQDHYTLSLQGLLSGESKGKDTESFTGEADEDSAETLLYVGPQINFTWRNKLAANAGIDLPVSTYVSNVQLASDYRAHLAVTWRF